MSATHEHGGDGGLHDHFGVQRKDPTQTTTLRREYAAQFYKRFRRLKGLVWQGVAREDRLSLRQRSQQANYDEDLPVSPPDPPSGELPPNLRPEDEKAAQQFLDWFEDQEDKIVVGPERPNGTHWTDDYVSTAYRKGARDADRRLAQSGVTAGAESASISFQMPIHQRTLTHLFEANRRALKGVNDATSKEVGRVLANAMLEGQNPKVAARAINDRVDKIGITRARTHARTMVIQSYNEASLRRYEQAMGEDGEVALLAEFSHANDNRVCEQCLAMGGRTYSVREAKGVIPVHPRCRCTWVPVQRGVDV